MNDEYAGSGRLVGKICLITGAASGIGYATAERFVCEGATVILADRAEEALASAYSRICASGPAHARIRLDVTVEDAWMSAIAEIDKKYGRLDVLVNNAGYGVPRSIGETSLQEWRAIMAVNLDSVFLGTKHALALLARSGRGSIVNISSIIGIVSAPGAASYAAAKAGVHLFTKSTALECAAAGNGIRANSVHPGQVETPLLKRNMANADNPENTRETLARIPVGRIGQPREIAEAVVFLASDASSFMTGAELVIDGGYTAQ